MSKEKKGFLLYCDQKEVISKLSDNDAGKILKAIYEYESTKTIVSLDYPLELVFTSFKTTLDRDRQNYNKRCETNKKNIQNYWDNVKGDDTNEYNRIQPNTMATDSDIDIVSDSDIGINYVCNNSMHMHENICHLKSSFKNESCVNCQKKRKCKNPTSNEFLTIHSCTFEEYDKKRDGLYQHWVEERKAKGLPITEELFGYDWLNDKNEY